MMRRAVLLLAVMMVLSLSVPYSMTPAQAAPFGQTPSSEESESNGLFVVDVLPADDSVNVAADSTITVIFNRPIVPLTLSVTEVDIPSPIRITPAVDGVGEWLNTSIYVFRPTELAGGTTYTITVDGVTAADGTPLDAPFTWSFVTSIPTVTRYRPSDGSSSSLPDAVVTVTFDQPVDRSSAESAFFLRRVGSDQPAIAGTFTWTDGDRQFTFTPSAPLELATQYIAGIADGRVTSKGGGRPGRGVEWSFSTYPLPEVLGTDPYDGMQNAYMYGLTIYFASPMDISTLDERIRIEPEPEREPDTYYGDWDNSYSLSFPMEASTQYTITLEAGMADIFGNTIPEDTVIQFTTRAYDPMLSFQVPGDFGFYNAYNPQTRLFMTHLNVDRVDLSLYGVSLPTLFRATSRQDYYDLLGSLGRVVSEGELQRNWSITSVAPYNVGRYELLDLGADLGVFELDSGAYQYSNCPFSLPTDLRVGDIAVVIGESGPVRARSAPVDGEILELLYRDYQLPIIAGPECANGTLWWEVRLRDEQTAWVALNDGEEYLLRLGSRPVQTDVPLTAEGGDPLAPGLYFLQASATAQTSNPRAQHALVVATANITLYLGLQEITAWVTDINTAQPLAGETVTFYDRFGSVLGTAVTDDDGLASIAYQRYDPYELVIAVVQSPDQFGFSMSSWTNGIEGYNFGVNTGYFPEPFRVYLYTDRPIYRPDQPVYFRGVARQRDDMRYPLPQNAKIRVTISYGGEAIYDEQLDLSAFGTFSDQFMLAADASLGYYDIRAALVDPATNQEYSAAISFGVAEYRAPEFQVTLTPEASEVVNGDTIRMTVDSRYFFGGAVSGGSVSYTVISTPYSFRYTGRGSYSFMDYDSDYGASAYYYYGGGQVASGVGTLDEQGLFTFEVPAELEDTTQSALFTIEATVSDESGLSVSNRTDVIVHKGLVYPGVSPREYVATAGSETVIDLIAVDWQSQPVANAEITVEVVDRRWSSVQEQDPGGRTTWTYEVEEVPVTSSTVRTDANGLASFSFVPPNGGTFKVSATIRDASGNDVRSAAFVWVSSTDYVAWRQQNSNRIDLIANADNYRVGDTAEILITSPFQGTSQALITIMRGDVMTFERVTMESNSYVHAFEILPDYAPQIYVSVVLVKGVDENNPVAAFRMGLVQLNVSNEQKEITIEITPDVEQAGPGDVVTYTVRTTDYSGAPVSAEVGVGLTDLSVLTIADPNSSPILSYFYGEGALFVRVATPLTINVDQLTQTVLDTIKGGGGGFGEGGIFDIREEFVDTPYWNASVVTDANGTASFSVTLPDNLTTWRLDARAVTMSPDGDMLVGQATFDLLSTRPLLIRPITPRFFIEDDEVVLAAIVNNNTDAEQTVDVSMRALGVTLIEPAQLTQSVTIAAGSRQRVEWRVRVDQVETVDLTFFVANADASFTDASKPPLGQGPDRLLPVYRYEAPEVVGTAGVLRDAMSLTEQILLPTDLPISQAALEVSVDRSLAATTLDGLDYLQNFPHECIEQTVSRFLPNILTYRALASLGLENAELEAALRSNVSFGVQRLVALQSVDGGWGWFVRDRSNPLTTAYALIGLVEAQAQGFPVPATVIRNAVNYLGTTFVAPSPSAYDWELNRQAFVLYALAVAGEPQIGRMSSLFDYRSRLTVSAQSFLALAYQRTGGDSTRLTTLINGLTSAAQLSATGAFWSEPYRDYYNWDTDTRSTALALAAIVNADPENGLLPNIVRWLVTIREARAWSTTQETAWSVMALTDYMMASGELAASYDFSVALNGEPLLEGSTSRDNIAQSETLTIDLAQLLTDAANELTFTRTDGGGGLYYTAHLRASLPVQAIEPLDNGIILQRQYFLPDDPDTPVTQARVGQNVQVRLTIIVPQNRHYVVITDPIPAGTDAVNPNLATSEQIGTRPTLDRADPLSRGWGWWWFSNTEFRDEAVVLYAEFLPAGTYEWVYTIRAGLPGVYNVIPPTGEEFYFPEIFGRGAGSTFTILPVEAE